MNYKTNSATIYGVCAIFCRMAHAVVPSITCKDHLFSNQRLNNFLLVGAPEGNNSWYEEMSLIVEGGFVITSRPMCLNSKITSCTEAPAERIAKLRRRLAAGNLPRRYGWLFQVYVAMQLLQLDSMVSMVPVWVTLRAGCLEKQK